MKKINLGILILFSIPVFANDQKPTTDWTAFLPLLTLLVVVGISLLAIRLLKGKDK